MYEVYFTKVDKDLIVKFFTIFILPVAIGLCNCENYNVLHEEYHARIEHLDEETDRIGKTYHL